MRILVVGDAMLDEVVAGDCRRLCHEAPTPVFDMRAPTYYPGGAANVAANLARLAAAHEVTLFAATAKDRASYVLSTLLETAGVRSAVYTAPGTTYLKRRYVDARGRLLFRADEGGLVFDVSTRQMLSDRLSEAARAADLVVVSDYAKDTTPLNAIPPECCVIAAVKPPAEPNTLPTNWPARTDLLLCNAVEAARLFRPPEVSGMFAADDMPNIQPDALAAVRTGAVCVTLGGAGVYVRTPQFAGATPDTPLVVPDVHTVGAGDLFMAVLVAAAATVGGVAPGALLPLCTAATAAATAAVQRGVRLVTHNHPDSAAVVAAAANVLCSAQNWSLMNARQLGDWLSGQCVSLANGCFDGLHAGHMSVLRAAATGGPLVVAVNDDASVRKLKGDQRPLVPLAARIEHIRKLAIPGAIVIPFDGDLDCLVRDVRPRYLVKGAEYANTPTPQGADALQAVGGTFVYIPMLGGLSTTRLSDAGGFRDADL